MTPAQQARVIQVLHAHHQNDPHLLDDLVPVIDALLAEETAALRAALEEIMPRYREMFEALGLGDFTQSVAYEISTRALARVAPPKVTPPAKTCDQETWVDPAALRHDRCQHGWPPCCPTPPSEAS